MGSGASRHLLLPPCFRPSAADGGGGGAGFEPGQLDEALGHSFCYFRSSPGAAESPRSPSTAETAFRAISGASVSANSSAPLPLFSDAAAAPVFQSSASFSAIPLQLSSASGPLDRGFFLSGPIERGAHSGPLDAAVPFSGPLPRKPHRKRGRSFSGGLRRASLLPRSFSERNRPWVVPLRGPPPATRHAPGGGGGGGGGGGRVEWAHGKAGEDRSHVVVSEDHRWLFVGIYDGFNGPDAPEFLLSHLYRSVHHELRGLFWEELDEEQEQVEVDTRALREEEEEEEEPKVAKRLWEFLAEGDDDEVAFSTSGRFAFSMSRLKHGLGNRRKDGGGRVWFPRWQYDAREKTRISQEVMSSASKRRRRRKKMGPVVDHGLVLGALARALQATEAAYLEMTDRAMDCNPELALMGSCLLVVLMRDEDVYVMNVGDSRSIVAQYRLPQEMDSDGGNAEGVEGEEAPDGGGMELGALQLSMDHSTSIEEEVLRIREEHPDDDQCIANDRVKGRLKVTRAFGAGFLKQPKWNNALLEMFRNEYVGTTPYISCTPSLCHHKLGPNDQFLVLSSDGLYQYLSNEEVVLHVENFMKKFPDGDPAQSLIEELLFRAAEKAGMNFHELLDIPQGDRRKYHDDVTVMVISLEGRIWKSSGNYL